LYSITVPRSPEQLQNYGITHVVSLTNERDRPKIGEDSKIVQLHIDIQDNPFENLIISLEGLYEWIRDAILSGARVLVHCLQGISRSGAIIIAYLMRSLDLDYEKALAMARKYRPIITPNSGFTDQLRLWQEMEFSIHVKSAFNNTCGIIRERKPQYMEWESNRGILLSKGQKEKQAVMIKTMADMAAHFGRRRLEMKDNHPECGNRI
jgi:dual specificity phosphatase 12